MSPKVRIRLVAAAAIALSAATVTASPARAQGGPATKEDGYSYKGEYPVRLGDFLEATDKLTTGINSLIDAIDKDQCTDKVKYDGYLLSLNNALAALEELIHDNVIMQAAKDKNGSHYISIEGYLRYHNTLDKLRNKVEDARHNLKRRECELNKHSMAPPSRVRPDDGGKPDPREHSSVVARPVLGEAVIVPGAANPNLAGQPSGVSCCDGDSSPGQSPVLAVSDFAAGATFTFAATGMTDGAGTGSTGPDGAYAFNMTEYGLGIAPANGVGTLGLVGVFLSDSTPSGGSEPGRLDFSRGLNFASLSPGLNQIFWIGNGRTKAGAVQTFIAPAGATRLYLGTVDGTEWNNNTGSYRVTIKVRSGNL